MVASRKNSGFTLIELLVVMVILGILAAIAIPTFLRQKQRAYDTSAKSAVRVVATAEESYATTDGGGYTATYADLTMHGTDKNATAKIKIVGADFNGFCLEGFDTRAPGRTLYYWDSGAGGLSAALGGQNCSVPNSGAFDVVAPATLDGTWN